MGGHSHKWWNNETHGMWYLVNEAVVAGLSKYWAKFWQTCIPEKTQLVGKAWGGNQLCYSLLAPKTPQRGHLMSFPQQPGAAFFSTIRGSMGGCAQVP